MDPEEDLDEDAWCAEQRRKVLDYLAIFAPGHGDVGEVPAWFVAPSVSLWTIKSRTSPGWLGWWAITGDDLPTDWRSAVACSHPRQALRRFAAVWLGALEATGPDDPTIGDTGLPVSVAPLLRERAEMLEAFAADEALWKAKG